jgi:hypothetical protein
MTNTIKQVIAYHEGVPLLISKKQNGKCQTPQIKPEIKDVL